MFGISPLAAAFIVIAMILWAAHANRPQPFTLNGLAWIFFALFFVVLAVQAYGDVLIQ